MDEYSTGKKVAAAIGAILLILFGIIMIYVTIFGFPR